MMSVQKMNVLFVCPNINSRQVEAICCKTKRLDILCGMFQLEFFHISVAKCTGSLRTIVRSHSGSNKGGGLNMMQSSVKGPCG